MANETVLVVEDEPIVRDLLSKLLTKEGYRVLTAGDGEAGFRTFEEHEVDLIVTDLNMPRMSGMELIAKVRGIDRQVMIVVLTAYSSVESAVEAMKQGAYDYITKPFLNDNIRLTVRTALEQKRLHRENLYLRRELREKYHFENIIGSSDAMQAVYRLVEKVSRTTSTVLVLGESGTGKELVARAIHYNSERSEKPFIAVNCGALVETLLESELFGHKKGAFTGAVADRPGLFKKADGGSLFLDEISEVSPALQVKLLRALQEQEAIPVGGTEPTRFDIRVIAASNKNLEEEVAEGRFRDDLYYRINVVTIKLPPLRKRRDDVPLLARHFLKKYSEKFGRSSMSIPKETMQLLMSYSWPGNVRELENAVERALTLCEKGEIEPECLPDKIRQTRLIVRDPEAGEVTLEELERSYILDILEKTGGDKQRAAGILGINPSTLYRKLERYRGVG